MVQDEAIPYFYEFLPGKEELLTLEEFYSLNSSSEREMW